MEGTHGFSTEHPVEPAEEFPTSTPADVRGGEPLLEPIVEYRHRRTTTAVIDGNAVIGGYVYGTLPGDTTEVREEMAPLDGQYVFGNWSNRGFVEPDGGVFAATEPDGDDELWSIEELQIAGRENGELGEFVMSFGRDADGELYVLTTEEAAVEGDTGTVYRLAAVTEDGGREAAAPEADVGDAPANATVTNESEASPPDAETNATDPDY